MEIYCIKNPTINVAKRRSLIYKYCLIIALNLLFAIAVQAQSDLITLKFKDVSIETAIDEIRNQTDVNFIVNDEEIK